MPAFLRKYATATHVYIPIIKRGVVDFAVGADWTPATGDVKVSIDGGAAANIGTLPVAVAMGNTAYWDFTIASGEATGKKIIVTVADSATKAVEDQAFVIETFGHASAEYQLDLTDSVRLGLTALPNAAANANGGLPILSSSGTTLAYTLSTLTTYTGNTPQTGDCYPKVDTEVATLVAGVADIQGRLPAALVGGRIDASVGAMATGVIVAGSFAAGAIDAAAIATDALGALELAAGAASAIATAVRAELTTELGRIDVAISTRLASASYALPLDAAGVRTAVGLASASLDTQLGAIAGYLDTEIASLLTKVTTLQKLAEADLAVDTSVTPWALVFLENGTGGLGVGTELLRQPLRDVSGTGITDTTTVIGQAGF